MVEPTLSGRTVLVTGGTGFLGAALRRLLLRQGAVVHATSRTPQTEPSNWWQTNLENITSVRDLFREAQPDVVYHFAGQVTAAPDRDLVLPLYHSLLTSTVNVLVAASEFGCKRVVLAGSLTEPRAPNEVAASPYAAAKFAGTVYGKMFNAVYGLSVVIARPFMTYGPGQSPTKVVPYVIQSLLRGEAPKLSSGRLESDWIYVDDVVTGLARAGCAEGIDGAEIDLGSGSLVSLRDVVDRVEAIVGARGRCVFGAREERPLERPNVADVATADRLLRGWRPRVALDEGLARTVAFFRSGPARTR